MSDGQLTADDRALLEEIAHRHQHDRDMQDLREQQYQLRHPQHQE